MQVISGVGTPVKHLLNPVKAVTNLLSQGPLIRQFARRDIESRYRGSFLGLLWSLLNPLLMLGIYSFVFSTVFKAKWGLQPADNGPPFALPLLCGLLTFNLFAEVVVRAPTLVLSSPNLVKRVVFPLETLPVSALLVGMFNMSLMLLVWAAAMLLFVGHIPATALLFPVVVLPVLLGSLGLAWFLAGIGVFVRDTAPTVAVIVQMAFYLTPIVYPVEIVPERFQHLLYINPLTLVVEDVRRVLMWGEMPHWKGLAIAVAGAVILCLFGYAFFMKGKRAFADVL